MSLAAAALALLLDRLLGYPDALSRRIGHPVAWIGALIAAGEARLNDPALPPAARRRRGLFLALGVYGLVLAVTIPLALLLRALPWGFVIEAVLASSLLAAKELGRAVRAVARDLERSLPAGRRAVSHIVGRDTAVLREDGVARAAIESLAENASDGVVAPFFFLALFGLPGIALYKAVNTADSMIGHKTERYLDFGRSAARIDDGFNLVPARLTGLLFVLAALLRPGADPARALGAMRRDASRHVSPNAGWPEAALAGALDFALGGPRTYGERLVDLPSMGEGRRDLGPRDISTALSLYGRALDILLALAAFAALLALVLQRAVWLGL